MGPEVESWPQPLEVRPRTADDAVAQLRAQMLRNLLYASMLPPDLLRLPSSTIANQEE